MLRVLLVVGATTMSAASSSSSPNTTRDLKKHHNKNETEVHHVKRTEVPMLAPDDYPTYSCNYINILAEKHPDQFDECQFAHTCNEGDGIIFPSLFCNKHDYNGDSGGGNGGGDGSNGDSSSSSFFDRIHPRHVPLLLFLLLALLLLFRLLTSTTDEFFSPGLEMFSLQLGLPPRFAGVTLLALGNAAPDVAATMNAILGDEKRGYEMALGELTGMCMFVTSVILGMIVSLSGDGCEDDDAADENGSGDAEDNETGDGESESNRTSLHNFATNDRRASKILHSHTRGIPCQGSLVRDIAVLVMVCIISLTYLRRGVIDFAFVYTLLGMYVAYVLAVLGADCHHLFYHTPLHKKLQLTHENVGGVGGGEEEARENQQQIVHRGVDVDELTPLVSLIPEEKKSFLRSASAPVKQQQRGEQLPTHALYHSSNLSAHNHSIRDTVLEAMSNYSCSIELEQDEVRRPLSDQSLHKKESDSSTVKRQPKRNSGWAPINDDGTEPLVTFHPHHAVHPQHGSRGLLFVQSSRSPDLCHRPNRKRLSVDGIATTGIKKSSSCDSTLSPQRTSTYSGGPSSTDIATSVSTGGNPCEVSIDDDSCGNTDPANIDRNINRPNGWADAWAQNRDELVDHWHDFFTDIYFNEGNNMLEIVLLSVELPFTILRKLTNPVPCDGYYCRPLVAISLCLSPLWLWYYFVDQFDVDIFSSSAGYVIVAMTLTSGLVVVRYAPGGDGPLDIYMVIPLTLYGFALAATWLDVISDNLVDLLNLFGILLNIPATVMGLTVLAFGNSSQDLIANVSLSKKGLSIMATTACFAAPIFGLCVGLSFGFWALLQSSGRDEIHVSLPSNIATGFYFTIFNCASIVVAGVVGKGFIGKYWGYFGLGLYAVYVATSLYIA